MSFNQITQKFNFIFSSLFFAIFYALLEINSSRDFPYSALTQGGRGRGRGRRVVGLGKGRVYSVSPTPLNHVSTAPGESLFLFYAEIDLISRVSAASLFSFSLKLRLSGHVLFVCNAK